MHISSHILSISSAISECMQSLNAEIYAVVSHNPTLGSITELQSAKELQVNMGASTMTQRHSNMGIEVLVLDVLLLCKTTANVLIRQWKMYTGPYHPPGMPRWSSKLLHKGQTNCLLWQFEK